MSNVIIKNFQNPDEVRYFEKGKFELIKLNNMVIGKATYNPGWKWSEHVSPLSKTKFCEVEHYGKVLSGSATVFCLMIILIYLRKEIYFMFLKNLMIVGSLETKNIFLYTF